MLRLAADSRGAAWSLHSVTGHMLGGRQWAMSQECVAMHAAVYGWFGVLQQGCYGQLVVWKLR